MPKRPLVKGGKPFQYRNGADGFFWRGMATKVDPGAQPLDRPRLVVNGRYIGGNIVARQPFAEAEAIIPQYTGPAETGNDFYSRPHALFEHHSYAGVRLWFGSHMPVQEDATGGSIGFFDTDWDRPYNEAAVIYDSLDIAPPIVRYGNFIYFGDTDALRRLYRFEGKPGGFPATYSWDAANEVVAAFTGFHVSALHVHDGILYIVVTDPADISNGSIYSWNGYQITLEYAMSVTGADGVSIASYLTQVVVTVRGLGSIIVRAVDGSWSTATVGGFDSSGYLNSMALLKDKLYIMEGDTEIYTWNGTALALVHTITTGTAPEAAVTCCAFNGRLYYGWSEFIAADGDFDERWPWVGMFDPDTVDTNYDWDDEYLNPWRVDDTRTVTDSHSVGGEHDIRDWGIVSAMAVYRQRLYVAVGTQYGVGTKEKMSEIYTHSVANEPSSGWYEPNTADAGPIQLIETSATSNGGRAYFYFKVF